MQVLVNGQAQTQIAVHDRGLAYGDGVFETIAVIGTHVQFWAPHWQRLESGLKRLGFHCDTQQLKQLIESDMRTLLAPSNGPGVLKITVTRGQGGRGYLPPEDVLPNRIVQLTSWPEGREHLSGTGVSLCLCKQRWSANQSLAGLKHLNRLDQVLARQEWHSEAYHEGIMLNQQGNVQSAVMSNVFIEVHGQLLTPINDTAGINGIMAAQVMQLASHLGISLQQQKIKLSQLESADGVFLTNSLNGIWPVVKFAQLDYAIGPITQRLLAALPAHIDAHSQPIS